MRKKLREIMDKEEGFTLVELLAVIVILGIIIAIAIPAVGNVINKAQSNADEQEIELIKDAGRMYFTTDEEGIKAAKEGAGSVIVVTDVATETTLVGLGYLENDKVDKAKHEGAKVTIDAQGTVDYVEPKP